MAEGLRRRQESQAPVPLHRQPVQAQRGGRHEENQQGLNPVSSLCCYDISGSGLVVGWAICHEIFRYFWVLDISLGFDAIYASIVT